ncbi:hypothetical protein RHSIM_Rhsim04G0107000 [Rhododendron simsii]|uniref:Uncharacterized protein n=1 Tax=Rhododendron simsii TaxID=118357 RepID=A0A834H0L4_RHOSS|nr:hypothetical protein RHSIM_Rhsim04G0107000 [Rhododendron simsii]
MDEICWDENKFESCCDQLSYSETWQKKFDSPMPLIGVYIAVASLVCSLAMAADVIHGIRGKKLWFPCKFFTINAASLTILTVAMKLPVGLNTGMWSKTDHLAHLSSNVFMTISMGNFLTSLASLGNNAIFLNIIALGILVVTIIVNVCIEIRNSILTSYMWTEEIFIIVSMLVLYLISISSALPMPTTKRYLELKCSELNEKAFNEVKMDETGKLTNQKLKEVVQKYWVMAETGSPQFVMARSVNAAMSGVICILSALTLVEALIRMHHYEAYPYMESPYKWSTSWILWIQFMGVVVGTIAPLFRWFTLISLNFSEGGSNNHRNESKLVENYWIQRLVEWKERALDVQIRSLKCRKVIHFTKNIVLDLCIGIQFGIVVASKVVWFISVICVSPLFLFCDYCKKLTRSILFESHAPSPVEPGNAEPAETLVTELNLGDYVLRLEGEAFKAKLPKIQRDMNQMIQKGKRRQLKNMMELLRKSNHSFKGVAEFDSSQVPNILHLEPPHCWTLPVVTLTSLAIALPNIRNKMADKLLRSVSECLEYAKLVEKSFSSQGDDFLNVVKKATYVIWVEVEHDRKWLSKDLQKLAVERKTTKETLQSLVEIAEQTINEFQKNKKAGILMENPLSWPNNVIAANSMYRISKTILNNYEGVTLQTDENLFEHLCCMIADILGACLTNLPHVIIRKCYCSAIDERERSVREAACLLGEAEEILEFLQDHGVPPSLEGDRAASIDAWRACMELETPPACVGLSNHEEMAASCSGEMHITMDE